MCISRVDEIERYAFLRMFLSTKNKGMLCCPYGFRIFSFLIDYCRVCYSNVHVWKVDAVYVLLTWFVWDRNLGALSWFLSFA